MSLFLATCLTLLPYLVLPAAAQTWSSCNPLNGTGCAPDLALGTSNASFTLNSTSSFETSLWNTTAGDLTYNSSGAAFTIAQKGDAPTIQTKFYIFFGEVEVWLKAAPGQGVVSSVVLQSDDLDEIDQEFIGNNDTHAENNYYGKGNTTDAYERAKWYPLPDGGSPTEGYHNYTTRWTNESLEWYIDGSIVRTLAYADANGGASYPQTPMNVRIGIWAGGDSGNSNYTIQWAGGEIDYTKGPYTMYVQSVRITDFSTGSEYKYGDTSGTWQSIQTVPGNSTALKTLTAPPPESVTQRFNGLSHGAKIGIFSAVAAAIAVCVVMWAFCCVKQRRAGKAERRAADAIYEKDTAELMAYRARVGKSEYVREREMEDEF